jgi:anti-sigma regulatory factor (Ser/Thr protein kinase)
VISTRTFPCHPDSVARARRFVREIFASEPQATLDAAELMVSELATNGVQHARTEFDVTVHRSPGEIRVEVRDRGRGKPAVQFSGPTEPTGRGLLIVESLSDSWGVVPALSGKTVWFSLARAPAVGAAARGSAPAVARPATDSEERRSSTAGAAPEMSGRVYHRGRERHSERPVLR